MLEELGQGVIGRTVPMGGGGGGFPFEIWWSKVCVRGHKRMWSTTVFHDKNLASVGTE
jgi:hypothetical protein